VHDGDAVTFVFDGFHTATLLPANTDADAWVQDNAVAGPFSFIIPNPDDGGTAAEPALKGNPAALFPSLDGAPATCGSEADPCATGAAVVNSGVPFDPTATFTATIEGAVGDVLPVLCLIHLNMWLDITVVDAPTAATTQAEIDANHDSTVQSDATKAGKRHDKLVDRQTGTQLPNGTTMWDAFAGVDGAGWALLGMYPSTLEIDRGDTVRWHFDELVFEDHTVSMPFAKARAIFNQTFVPLCDLDGEGSEPRTEPDLPPPTFCSAGEVEFAVPPKMAFERGNGTFRGSDYENSGVEGANIGGVDPYDVKFTAVSPNKGFRYFCLIHSPFMDGRVVVQT
jgi:plastocyanin